jgi:valyl-tRNA synthetase
MNLEDYQGTCDLEDRTDRSLADRWILSRLNKACNEVNTALTHFRFNDAANAIYKFLWNEYCDWYIELSKSRLNSKGPERHTTQNVMVHVLEAALKLLHPIMPFITEEIWQKLPREGVSIMTAPFPKADTAKDDEKAEATLQVVMDVITRVRNIRGEMNFNPGQQLALHIKSFDPEHEQIVNNNSSYINDLARVSELRISPDIEKPKAAASAVLSELELYVPLEGLMDFDEEKKRVEKELKKIDKDMVFLNKKLSNPNFVDKAPPEVIAKDRQRLEELSEKQAKLQVHLKTILEATS